MHPVAGPLNHRRGTTIGALRDRVEVQAPVRTANEFREPVTSYATETTVWAKVELEAGAEMTRGGRQEAVLTGTVTMRFLPGLDPTKKLVWVRADGVRVGLNITACPPHAGAENFVVVSVTTEHKPGAA